MPLWRQPPGGFIDWAAGKSRLDALSGKISEVILGRFKDLDDDAKKTMNSKTIEVANWYFSEAQPSQETDQTADPSLEIDGQFMHEDAAKIINWLRMNAIGKNYSMNTALRLGPTHYDCSGLVTMAYKQIGINVPGRAEDQRSSVKIGKYIDLTGGSGKGNNKTLSTEQIMSFQPGDILFHESYRGKGIAGHVGICVGNNSGKWIHASSSKNMVVEVNMGYIKNALGVRRILTMVSSSSSGATGSGTGTPMDIRNGNAVTLAELKTIIGKMKNGNRIINYAGQISSSSAKFGVNPIFSLAMAAYETGWFTSKAFLESKNIGGLSKATHMYKDSGISAIVPVTSYQKSSRWAVFKNPGDSFQAKIWLISDRYFGKRGHRTVEDVIKVYAPAVENDVSRYVNIVDTNMKNFLAMANVSPNVARANTFGGRVI